MRSALFAIALLSSPAMAQTMDHSQHDGHQMHDMAGMDDPPAEDAQEPRTDHSAHQQHNADSGTESEAVGTDAPPPVPSDHFADRVYPPGRMTAARAALMREDRFSTYMVSIDQLEYRSVSGRDGYGWKGSLQYGGDIDRIVLASEGEGEFRHSPERAEVTLSWRHALDPWFNLELGARHDFEPSPQRTYAAVGIEGLAPHWIEVEAWLFLSDKGDLHSRLGAHTDQRITQRLILRPEVEFDIAFQDVPQLDIAGGIERIELGARLRYEIGRQVAPYLGLHWERKLGGTARLARLHGDRPSALSAVFGIRTWF